MIFILICTFGSTFGLLNIIKYGYGTFTKELGLPVFVRAFQPSGTVKARLGKVNVPVVCGGVGVQPGDLIVGDCDGVVVIPQDHEDEVIEQACSKFDKEQKIVEQLKQGKTTLEIYGFDRLIQKLS